MRIASRLAACAAVAGIVVAGGTAAAPARAAVPAVRIPGTASVARPALLAPFAKPARAPGPVGVRSPWAELAVASTGAVLWSRSSATTRPMGSITKVMTAYVVLQLPRLKLSRVITVPTGIIAYDTKYDASTAGLRPGEKLTTLQLLYAMLLPSGCDAAYTLADAYGPGLKGFIARMNATARKLGLAKTHFSDFSGLPDPGEYTTYSTARDLVNLGLDAMKLKTFAAIVATRVYKVTATAGHRAHVWKNLNPLLGKYPGAIGIKTGFTNAAGECLLFEARRGSKTLIGVVLHSSSDGSSLGAAASDAAAMLNWGFRPQPVN
jgi:serine-type D-Ala-D-Ala carboxypeptidase (penicillin-binding protein 5/6)